MIFVKEGRFLTLSIYFVYNLPLPYIAVAGVFRHMFCMAKGLHISKSGQGVAILL